MRAPAIRLKIAAITALLSVLGSIAFSEMEMHNAAHLGTALPVVTALVGRWWPWTVMVPIALMAGGHWASHRGRDELTAILRDLLWAVALLWPLATFLAWKLPFLLL